jgi:hypothetical protein
MRCTFKKEASCGQFQRVDSLEWNDGVSRTVYLKAICFPVKLLKKIFTNEDGSSGTLYLICNDLILDADRMYEVYQKGGKLKFFINRLSKMQVYLNHQRER